MLLLSFFGKVLNFLGVFEVYGRGGISEVTRNTDFYPVSLTAAASILSKSYFLSCAFSHTPRNNYDTWITAVQYSNIITLYQGDGPLPDHETVKKIQNKQKKSKSEIQ